MDLNKREKKNKTINKNGTKEQKTPGCPGTPDVDIFETQDQYELYFDLPGVEKEEINLKIEKDILTLSAEIREKGLENLRNLREEMRYTGFSRSFNLNNNVFTEQINADYQNGTLKVILPKKEAAKTKEITIN